MPLPGMNCQRGELPARAGCSTPPTMLAGDPEMVGKLGPGEAQGKALRVERPHRSVPVLPFGDETLVDVGMAILEVGTLHRILHDIEQERIVEDLEVLPVAVADRPLSVVLVAPEEL